MSVMSMQGTVAILNECLGRIRQQSTNTDEELGAIRELERMIQTLGGSVANVPISPQNRGVPMGGFHKGNINQGTMPLPPQNPPPAGEMPQGDKTRRDPHADDNL